MAIDTHLKLRAAVASTINRDDLSADITAFEGTTIESEIKRAVAIATASVQRDLVSRGGHKGMEALDATLTTAAGTEYVDFPADFVGVRSFILMSDPLRVLVFLDPTGLWTAYPNAAQNKPEKFTIIGARRAYLRPIPDAAYTIRLVYSQALTALDGDTDTNWLLTSHPDIYIAACMIEVCLIVENDDRLQYWKGIYDQKMNDLMGDDRNVRWAAVPAMPTLPVAIA